jgi:hypothetical protein
MGNEESAMKYHRCAVVVLIACLLSTYFSPELPGQESEKTKAGGTIVLKGGREIYFERLSPDSDLSGEYLYFTDDSAEIEESMPSLVKVGVGSIRNIIVGPKIVKKKHVSAPTRTIACEWLAVTVTLSTGEKETLRAGTSALSDAIVHCGRKVMLYIEKSGVKREIDLLSVKEVRFKR